MSDIHETLADDDTDDLEFDPSQMTWIIQDGTAHLQCRSGVQAMAVKRLLPSICGSMVEGEGALIYCCFEMAFEDLREHYFASSEDAILVHVHEKEDQCVEELRAAGFNVRIEA